MNLDRFANTLGEGTMAYRTESKKGWYASAVALAAPIPALAIPFLPVNGASKLALYGALAAYVGT